MDNSFWQRPNFRRREKLNGEKRKIQRELQQIRNALFLNSQQKESYESYSLKRFILVGKYYKVRIFSIFSSKKNKNPVYAGLLPMIKSN